MRSLTLFSLSVALLLVGCTSSRAQEPKEYRYAMPCSTWTEPAHIMANEPAGVADTTLALLSGRIVNYLGTYGTDVVAAKNTANGQVLAGAVDKQGRFSLYVPEGHYSVQVMSLDYSPFTAEGLELHSGQRYKLDVFLHVTSAASSTCISEYKSKHKLSPEQLEALAAKFAKQDEERTRHYLERLKNKSSTKTTP